MSRQEKIYIATEEPLRVVIVCTYVFTMYTYYIYDYETPCICVFGIIYLLNELIVSSVSSEWITFPVMEAFRIISLKFVFNIVNNNCNWKHVKFGWVLRYASEWLMSFNVKHKNILCGSILLTESGIWRNASDIHTYIVLAIYTCQLYRFSANFGWSDWRYIDNLWDFWMYTVIVISSSRQFP